MFRPKNVRETVLFRPKNVQMSMCFRLKNVQEICYNPCPEANHGKKSVCAD